MGAVAGAGGGCGMGAVARGEGCGMAAVGGCRCGMGLWRGGVGGGCGMGKVCGGVGGL